MHRKQHIQVLVYNNLFPNPRPEDPATFSAHLSKNLVGEVRIETATFYGSLDTVEARYPGLNYSHPPHRKRLGRFPHHARLFRAFDELGLTPSEIAGFCRWEGTLWARERYERDEGIKVIDTTGQEIRPWVDNRGRRTQKAGINVKTHIEVEIVEAQAIEGPAEDETMEEEGNSDEDITSGGDEPPQRLSGIPPMTSDGFGVSYDPLWEQYLKEQQEREQQRQRRGTTSSAGPIMTPPLPNMQTPIVQSTPAS